MNNRTIIIALFGKSASGKDSIATILTTHWGQTFFPIISCTSRPPRDYEVDGEHYHFISQTEFYKERANFLETTMFNGWLYGTRKKDLVQDRINVGVFDPAGVRHLLEYANTEDVLILPIWVQASDKVRMSRALNREELPNYKEISRRFKADEIDFENIDFPHYVLDNEKNDGAFIADPYELTFLVGDILGMIVQDKQPNFQIIRDVSQKGGKSKP